MTIKERILLYISSKGIKKGDFYETIGMAASNFKGSGLKSDIGGEKIVKILTIYNDISPLWLLLEIGEMLKSDNEECHENIVDNDDRIIKIKESEISRDETRYIPHIPYEIAAGSLSANNLSLTSAQCPKQPHIKQFNHYDYTVNVKGESMSPDYRQGDQIACAFIDHTSFIQWGEVHCLDTAQGFILKKIYDAGDRIKCVSINNENYPAFYIQKQEIFRIAKVVGIARMV